MRRAAALLALAPLAGCGLHPLYADGGHGPVASALARVEVAPIQGKAGWLMANALSDRFAAAHAGDQPALYRLEVKLDDQIIGLGIRRTDDAITRERRTLRARFQLVELATGTVVLDATAGSDSGIDVTGSGYATIAAEDTALENLSNTVADQITSRVAVYARGAANRS